jgi:AbrB family looped-hinge helix DNA binding protein
LSGAVADAAWEDMFTARVRKDNRIVIPKACREALRIREGDLVKVRIRKTGAMDG